MWILTVGYPGGRTRQLSLRAAQVPQVRAWLAAHFGHRGQSDRGIVITWIGGS
jgi:hypothetical protein